MVRQAKFGETIWYEPSRLESRLEKEIRKYGFQLGEARIDYTSDHYPGEMHRKTGKLDRNEASYDDILIIQSQLNEGELPEEIVFDPSPDPRVYLIRRTDLFGKNSILYVRESGHAPDDGSLLLDIYNVGQQPEGRSERYCLNMKEAIGKFNEESERVEYIVFNKGGTNLEIVNAFGKKFSIHSNPSFKAGQKLLADAFNSYYGTSFQPDSFLGWYDKNSPEGRRWGEEEKEKRKKEIEGHTSLLQSVFSEFSIANLDKTLARIEPSKGRKSSAWLSESFIKVMVPYLVKSGSQVKRQIPVSHPHIASH